MEGSTQTTWWTNEPRHPLRVSSQWTPVIGLGAAGPGVGAAARQINKLLELRENWNSYDAKPISPEAASEARRIVGLAAELGRLPEFILPTTNRGIQLEWKSGNREVEIEIQADGEAEILVVLLARGDEFEFAIPSFPLNGLALRVLLDG